jgi:hypothetical protein
MEPRILDIDPAIPHDLVGKVAVLWNAHGVDFAAAAVVLRAAMMGICVREHDIHPAAVDAAPGARTFSVIVVPAQHVFDGVGILVAVVGAGVLAFVQGTVAIPVERRRKIVPVLAQRFVA